MDQRSRSSSPNDANTRHQKEAENRLPEASSANNVQELRAHHMITGGQHPREWQASTSEASPSGLDRQSAIREESDDKQLHLRADSHYARREYDKAEPLYEAVLQVYEQEFGRDDSETLTVRHSLADVCKKQKKYDKAKSLYEDLLPIYKREFGEDDPKTEKVEKNLASLAEKLGQPLEGYVGRQLGDYRLVDRLGHGGFGDVYLGEHVDSKRKVAVKLLKDTHLTDEESVKKFREEAGNLLRLKNEHIVDIEGVGITKDKIPYLVMEYAPNGTLRDAHPRDTRLFPGKVAEYVNQIASALQHVHDKNLMHLDLKPDNVLLGVEGQLLLTDFGLVQDIHRTCSQPTQRMGTAQYASPEQFYDGKPRKESDQYALGVMVYEWLSGKRPFFLHAPHPDQNVRFEPLHGRIDGISSKMERVVFKALKPKPEDRYDSVKEFAEAFEQACRDSSQKESKEQRGGVSQLWQLIKRSGGSVEKQEVQVQEQVSPMDQVLRGEGTSSQPDTTDLSVLRNPERLTVIHTLKGHKNDVLSVALSADGQTLVSASLDKTIKIWNIPTGQLLHTLTGHEDRVNSVILSTDGQTLVSASGDRRFSSFNHSTIKIWDTRTGQLRDTLTGHTHAVSSLALSADGQTLVSASWDDTIKIWDMQKGRCSRTLTGHTNVVSSLTLSADGKTLVSASGDNTIKIWDMQKGRCRHTLTGHTNDVLSVALSADGRTLVSTSLDKTIKIWDMRTRKLLHTLTGHKDGVWSVALSADEQTLVSGSWDHTIKIWDMRTRKLLHTLTGHRGWVWSVALSADGQTLVSTDQDATIKIWGEK